MYDPAMRTGVGVRRDLLLRLLGTIGAAACGTRTELPEATRSVDASRQVAESGPADVVFRRPADSGKDADAPCGITRVVPPLRGDATAPHVLCVGEPPVDGGGCPSAAGVLNGDIDGELCGVAEAEITRVLCGPVVVGTDCCYEVEQGGPVVGCYVGRAFLVDEGLIKSALVRGLGWGGPAGSARAAPQMDGLSGTTRRALADGWVLDGLFEHASVASFARLSMQLLAAGAPSDLLRDTHAAAVDEVHHAELCFALASAYAGEALAPSALPVPDTVPIPRGLEDIVAESVVEGCIGETLAAAQAAESLARATDPAVRIALEETLNDEIRHAELAWRIVSWAIGAGGERVRRKVARTFASFVPPKAPDRHLDEVDAQAFAAHGRLTPDEARAVALWTIAEVVEPCACALLSYGVA